MTDATHIAAVGVLTGWGTGVEALPADARLAAGGRQVVVAETNAVPGERFRRATRECLLGVHAVDAALRQVPLARDEVRGPRTALVYATAAAYGASNVGFLDPTGNRGALHFPYTAPSAVPAEVAIEFGLTGGYVIFIGGATATVEALSQASRLVARGQADRALVLAVETFRECADLYGRARWLVSAPLVEAAACAVVVGGGHGIVVAGPGEAGARPDVRHRAGETFACGPLIALALGMAGRRGDHDGRVILSGQWRGRSAALRCEIAVPRPQE
jgi:3-oxoacyl-[acyl-carrier-protein] synthase III